MSNTLIDDYELMDMDDKEKLKLLTCPVPDNETRRLAVLHQTRLLDSSPNEATFDRFTHLASLIFNMPVALITLVDVDRVWFKSRIGVDWTDVGRNDSFDAYTVLADNPEVFVVPDIADDSRFLNCDLHHAGSPIRFYAGAAVVVDDVKIGALCIMDTDPHQDFSREDKENLLDLCAGLSQLAHERRQRVLDLDTERANIVVSMMHNLRTPMTTLNFATSLLAAEAVKLRPSAATAEEVGDEDDDGSDDGNAMGPGPSTNLRSSSAYPATPTAAALHIAAVAAAAAGNGSGISPSPAIDRAESGDSTDQQPSQPEATRTPGSAPITPSAAEDSASAAAAAASAVAGAAAAAAAADIAAMEPMFSTFDVCYREISVALKQLNLIVDSSLTLGQAVIKIGDQVSPSQGPHKSISSADMLASFSAGISDKSSVASNSALPVHPHANESAAAAVGGASVNASASASTNVSVNGISPKHGMGSMRPLLGARVASAANGSGDGAFYPEMDGCRYVPCDLLEHVEGLYRTLITQVTGTSLSWEVNPSLLSLGKHASYPEAVSLVLISALGQLRGQHKNVRIRFHFERCAHEADLEFPEVAHKLIEGTFVIRVQAYSNTDRTTTAAVPGLGVVAKTNGGSDGVDGSVAGTAAVESSAGSGIGGGGSKHISFSSMVDTSAKDAAVTGGSSAEVALAALQHQSSDLSGTITASNKTSVTSGTSAPLLGLGGLPSGSSEASADQTDQYLAHYNLLSVNKVLRTVNGGCHEYPEPIPGGEAPPEDGWFAAPPVVYMPTQEYWVPCKILPTPEALQRMSVKAYLEETSADAAAAPALLGAVKHTYERSGSQRFEETQPRLTADSFGSSAPSSMKFRPSLSNSGSMRHSASSHSMSGKRGAAGVGGASLLGSTVGGEGATVTFTGEESASVRVSAEPKTLRVLIIEDTLPVQKLLRRWMETAKCKVSCAANGMEGLTLLMNNRFDIVFIDFLMPVMLGVATMMHFQAWVREHAASNEIAAYNTQLLIVGMSATALQSEQEAAFNYGMHFFCPKPAKMEILGLMLDAKRACATNEAALDMICAATGTDYYTEPVQDFCHAEDLEEGDETLDEDGCFLDHHHPQYLKQQRQRVDSETDVNPATGFSHEASQHGDWVDLSALTAAATATESSVAPEGDSSIKASSKGSGKVPGEDIDAEVASAAAGALHTAQSSSSLVGSVTGSFTAVGSAASLAGSAAAAPAAINSSSSPSIAHPKAAVTDSHSAAEWSVFRSYRQSARSVAVVAPSASVAGAVEEAVRVAVASVAGKDEVSTNESAL